jgi:hypothetical protein
MNDRGAQSDRNPKGARGSISLETAPGRPGNGRDTMKSERGQELVSTALIFFMFAVVALMAWYIVIAPALGATVMPQVQIPSYTDHAVERHSDVIASATTCFSGYGTISPQSMFNKNTNRDAWVCQMDGKFFIWITNHDTGDTVTMFKNKAKTLFDAIKYLTNVGYE